MPSRASFTLIELLVVIGIVAILSVVVILVLNPAQMLRQARDSNRLSDLNTLTKAVSFFETDQPGGSIGTASTTYFSIVDPAATSSLGSHCQGTGLPSAPSDWTYRCPASSTLRLTNGTGWIPVNFDQMSFKAISALPVDPTNTTSSGAYYTYTPGGSFALTATLESEKYLRDKATNDAGYDPGRFEQGTDLALVARSQGLVGWWKLDEGGGTTAGDSSGNGRNGTWINNPTSTSGKIGGALNFTRSSNQYVEYSVPSGALAGMNAGTLVAWVYKASNAGFQAALGLRNTNATGTYWFDVDSYNSNGEFYGHICTTVYCGGAGGPNETNSLTPVPLNTWTHLAVTYQSGAHRLYMNGSLVGSAGQSGGLKFSSGDTVLIYVGSNGDEHFDGRVDDARIYSRVLAAKEIEALYNATK